MSHTNTDQANTDQAPISTLSFEESLKELETIVKKLETGKETLESAISDYERGNALRIHCENKLAEARLKVEKIVKSPEGTLSTEPFSTSE